MTSVSLHLIPLQFTCQADQWRDSWADWGHLRISHRPGKNSPAEPAEWPADVHQHVSTTWQGVLPLCYLFQVSSAFLGTGLSPGKPGDNLELSCARADKAALQPSGRGLRRGHVCLHRLLGSSVCCCQGSGPKHKEPSLVLCWATIRCRREFLPLFFCQDSHTGDCCPFLCCVSFKNRRQSPVPSVERCMLTC